MCRAVGGIKFTPVDLTGRVYAVTGSSAGIGLETAREIVRMGGTVVLACRWESMYILFACKFSRRSKGKALKARDDILSSTGASEAKVFPLTLRAAVISQRIVFYICTDRLYSLSWIFALWPPCGLSWR